MDARIYLAISVIYFFIFTYGVCIGSFLNVLIYRIPLGISFAKGRSFCPKCKNGLKAIDLIPILSFLCLRGKCRYCGEKISIRYPIIELFTGTLTVLCFTHFGFTPKAILASLITFVLITIALIDLDTMEIPNGLNIALAVLAVCGLFIFKLSAGTMVSGFLIISVPMFLLTLLIPDAFGGGDIKLIAISGLILGFSANILAMFIALLSGGVQGCYILFIKKEKGVHMPFGQHICLGIFISMLWGGQIINWYLGLFGLI